MVRCTLFHNLHPDHTELDHNPYYQSIDFPGLSEYLGSIFKVQVTVKCYAIAAKVLRIHAN